MDPEEAGFGAAGGGGSPGGGGFSARGFPGGGGFSGGHSFDNADAFKMFNSMFGGGAGVGGFANLFGGGGFGGGGASGRKRQQPIRQPTKIFNKDDPSGVVPLGRPKFPDAKSKHAWLILFYDTKGKDSKIMQQYISTAK
jgi:hypothetical protein